MQSAIGAHRLCLECQTEFTLRSLNQLYCGPRCRQKAERQRSRDAQGAKPQDHGVRKDLLASLHDATAEQLEKCAKGLEIFQDKVVVLTGRIPQWQKPDNITMTASSDRSIIMQFGVEFNYEEYMKQFEKTP